LSFLEPITQPLGADVKPMDYSEIKMKTQREIYGEQKLGMDTYLICLT